MPQYARPSTDTTGNTQFLNESGNNVTLYESINESVPSDTDYIVSAKNPSSNVYVTKLTAVDDPLVDTGHVINFRYKKDVAVNAEQIDLTVELRQDYANEASPGTLIANGAAGAYANIPSTWTNGTITLSNTAAGTINAYANLFLRFVFNKP